MAALGISGHSLAVWLLRMDNYCATVSVLPAKFLDEIVTGGVAYPSAKSNPAGITNAKSKGLYLHR
jgi:hypothetical protein